MNRSAQIRSLTLCLISVYACWTLWCGLMVWSPALFATPMLRAVIRVLVVALPAVIYVRKVERQPLFETLGLTRNIRYGVFCGLVAGGTLFGLVVLNRLWQGGSTLHVPLDLPTWLNWIIGSPLAEELLFRGVVYRVLRQAIGVMGATLISSLCFALLHAPWWLISGEKRGMELVVGLAVMVMYGMGFVLLYQVSRSLWASVVAHSLNNFAAILLAT